jgi:hypothetical protein
MKLKFSDIFGQMGWLFCEIRMNLRTSRSMGSDNTKDISHEISSAQKGFSEGVTYTFWSSEKKYHSHRMP